MEDIGCILSRTFSLDLPIDKAKLSLPQDIADLDLRLGLIDSPLKVSNLIP